MLLIEIIGGIVGGLVLIFLIIKFLDYLDSGGGNGKIKETSQTSRKLSGNKVKPLVHIDPFAQPGTTPRYPGSNNSGVAQPSQPLYSPQSSGEFTAIKNV